MRCLISLESLAFLSSDPITGQVTHLETPLPSSSANLAAIFNSQTRSSHFVPRVCPDEEDGAI